MKLLNILCALVLSASVAFAGYSSSSGGRSSSSSSSGGRSSGSSYSSSKTTPSSSGGYSSSKSTPASSTTTTTVTKSSNSSLGSFNSSSKVAPPKSRDAYVQEFKQQNATKYASTFDKEPAKRPDYIPTTHSSGGTTYNVIYDSGHRGYGYYDPLGTWIMFNALDHMAGRSYNGYVSSYPVYTSGVSGGAIFLIVLCGIVLIVVIGVVVSQRS